MRPNPNRRRRRRSPRNCPAPEVFRRRGPALLAALFLLVRAAALFSAGGEVEEFFLRGRYREAVGKAGAGEALSPAGRYLLAHCYRELGENATAQLLWEQLLDGPEGEKSLLALAQSKKSGGDPETSEKLFARFISEYPRSVYLPSAYLGIASLLGRRGKAAEQLEHLRHLRGYYPFSPEAGEANLVLGRLVGSFTVQVGSFSDLRRAEELARIMRRRNYDAYLTRLAAEKISYRVRAGNFPDEAAARAVAESLRAELGLEPFIARVP